MRSVLAAVVLALAACEGERGAAVDVAIDAEACSAAVAAQLQVRVLDAEGTDVDFFEAQVRGPGAEVTFPTGVRVVPRDGDAGRGWQIEARLLDPGGTPIAWQRARGGYVAGATGSAELLFDDACLGIECPAGETCVEALCVPDAAAPTRARHGARDACPPLVFVDGIDGLDADGCGEHDGPCATIQRAIDDWIVPGRGGVVHVRGGATYTGNGNDVIHLVSEDHEGGPTAPVVVRAWPGTGQPILDGRGTSYLSVAALMAYLVLDGLAMRGAERFGITLNGTRSHDVTIRRCEIYENGSGFSPYDNHSNIEMNNGAGGILVEDTILRNAIGGTFGATAPGEPGQHGDGVYANDSPGGLVMRRCEIHDNEGYGVFLSGVESFVIEDSRFVDNGRDGIGGSADGPFRIERVRICGSTGRAIDLGGADALRLHRNSLVDNDAGGLQLAGDGPVTFQGNLIAGNRGIGAEIAPDVEVIDGWNLYHGNADPLAGFVPDRPDTHVTADPRLVGIEPCDLELGEGSPARGAGPDGANIGAR